jgi:isopenicillin-N N-acyltransferase-like protein
VHGSKAFYTDFFKTTAKLEWDAVCDVASRWIPLLEKSYPQYVDEMRGERHV